MRIVFIGATKFGMRCLNTILDMPYGEVVGVVTAPANFTISYKPEGMENVLHADFHSFCITKGISCAEISNGMKDDALFQQVSKWLPDVFIVVGWYHLIPAKWREMAHCYGMHASLLPDYSGGAPLVWAMINGETKTGITLFRIDKGVDTGPIVGQEEEQIKPGDTIDSLYKRIEERGVKLLSRHIHQIATNSVELREQNKSERRVFPPRLPKDGKIDWTKGCEYIERFIRAQTRPYPGAYTLLREERLHIWRAKVTERAYGESCGSVVISDSKVFISTGTTLMELKEVTYQGKEYTDGKIKEVFSGASNLN